MKNPTIATLLNVIPGLGYIYLGTKRTFGVLVLAGVVLSFAYSLEPRWVEYWNEYYTAHPQGTAWDILGVCSVMIFVVAFMFDAYKEAMRINAGKKSK